MAIDLIGAGTQRHVGEQSIRVERRDGMQQVGGTAMINKHKHVIAKDVSGIDSRHDLIAAGVTPASLMTGLTATTSRCTLFTRHSQLLTLLHFTSHKGCQITRILWEIPYFSSLEESQKKAIQDTKSPVFDYADKPN